MARGNRFIDQATLQALVRFGPELSGLKALQRQALATYATTTKGAQGAADYIVSTARGARPQANRDWTAAGLAAARSAHNTLGPNQPDPNNPGNSAAQLAILGEQAGIQSRIAESKANELQDLRGVQVRARQGAAWAQTSARNDLVKTLEDVFQRRQDLAGEKGAYIASTAQDLANAAADRNVRIRTARMGNRQSERNSLRSAGIDPDTGKPIPGGPLDPKAPQNKKKGARATANAIGAAQDEVTRLLPLIQRQRARGRSRQDVMTVLLNGIQGAPVYRTDATGKQVRVLNPDGTQKVTGSVDPAKSALLLKAALDTVYGGGYVSEAVRRRLHSRGIYLTDLGLMSRQEYLRRRRRNQTETGIRAGLIAGPPAP